MDQPKTLFNDQKLQFSCELVRALAHPLRLRMLSLIDQNDALCVHDIFGALKLEQSVTSQHLRVLRDVGLVNTERRGKFIYYTLNYPRLEATISLGRLKG
jgi:ArsR family transcriptional regulator